MPNTISSYGGLSRGFLTRRRDRGFFPETTDSPATPTYNTHLYLTEAQRRRQVAQLEASRRVRDSYGLQSGLLGLTQVLLRQILGRDPNPVSWYTIVHPIDPLTQPDHPFMIRINEIRIPEPGTPSASTLTPSSRGRSCYTSLYTVSSGVLPEEADREGLILQDQQPSSFRRSTSQVDLLLYTLQTQSIRDLPNVSRNVTSSFTSDRRSCYFMGLFQYFFPSQDPHHL